MSSVDRVHDGRGAWSARSTVIQPPAFGRRRFSLIPHEPLPARQVQPIGPPLEPEGAGGPLPRLARELGADHVSLLRVEHATGRLEVASVTGARFLAAGMELPLSGCELVEQALAGVLQTVDLDDADGALGLLALACGMRAATTIPVGRSDAAVAGVVLAAWAEAELEADEVYDVVFAEEAAIETLLLSSAQPASRVLVCHEDALTADGIARQLERRLRVTAVSCSSLREVLDAVTMQRPDLIACSDRLCEDDDLAGIATQVRAAGAAAPLLALAKTETAHSITAALRAGIAGYVSLGDGAQRIVEAVASVLDGRSVLPTAQPAPETPALTARELQVLRGFDRGLSYLAIARELHVAPSTIKSHSRHLFRKLGVGSRTAALHKARQDGLL